MAKNTPAAYDGPPARRIRAIRTGNNEVTLVEELFSGPPTKVVTLAEGVSTVGAMERVRIYNEDWLGHQRFGDSGL